jgi:hypothetical protein
MFGTEVRPNRASLTGPLPASSRGVARPSDDWQGLDQRESWTSEVSWSADPFFVVTEGIGNHAHREAAQTDTEESSQKGRRKEDGRLGAGVRKDRHGAVPEQAYQEDDESAHLGSAREGEEGGREEKREERSAVQEGGVREAGEEGGVKREEAQTSRQQAELESLIAYLESELVTRLQAFADLKTEVSGQKKRRILRKSRRIPICAAYILVAWCFSEPVALRSSRGMSSDRRLFSGQCRASRDGHHHEVVTRFLLVCYLLWETVTGLQKRVHGCWGS